MESVRGLAEGRALFGGDLLGPEEIRRTGAVAGWNCGSLEAPAIPEAMLEAGRREPGTHLLLLGAPAMNDGSPVTLLALRDKFGTDPALSEPCFYNQDWYLKETFASEVRLNPGWHLVRKAVESASRGQDPDHAGQPGTLPSAVLCAYAFFSHWLHSGGGRLWEHDYVWCSDLDHQGDRIYIGRYSDSSGVNKNGFSIHRHLRIRENYGVIDCLTS